MIAERAGDIAGQARHSDEAYAAFAAVGDEARNGQRPAGARKDRVGPRRRRSANAIYTELAELAERIGDRWNGAIALNNLGDAAIQSGDWERAVELCGRSSVLRRELGDEWGMALALCNVAFAELQLGRLSSAAYERACRARREQRIDCEDGRNWSSTSPSGLRSRGEGCTRQHVSPGRLRGCWRSSGSVRDSFEGGWFERAVESVRASLGSDDADAEIQHGRELSLEEAAAVALAATPT